MNELDCVMFLNLTPLKPIFDVMRTNGYSLSGLSTKACYDNIWQVKRLTSKILDVS